MSTPCRVSAELSQYEREQDRLEKEWELGRADREAQAMEDTLDREALKAVLNDEELIAPLITLMHDLENGADLKNAAERIKRTLAEIILSSTDS